MTVERSTVLEYEFFAGNSAELVSEVLQKYEDRIRIIFTPNPEQIVQANGDPEFRDVLRQADVSLPDGMGVVIASHVLSFLGRTTPIQERITGTDFATQLLEAPGAEDRRVLVVGGRDYDGLEVLGSQFQMKNAGEFSDQDSAGVIWWTPGYDDANSPSPEEDEELSSVIEEIQPELVFVSFGAPEQERWLIDHKKELDAAGVKVGMVVGGGFDFLTGKTTRAPEWVQSFGLEWAHRLMKEPWRWRRQLRLFVFIKLVIQDLLT